jgi:hypothetical protein
VTPEIVRIGSLLGIKTSALMPRLAPLEEHLARELVITVPHDFDALSVSTHTDRATALAVCGSWLDALPGDQLELEVSATSVTARSDEAALPPGAPALFAALGELAAVGWDGAMWTYVLEHGNADDAARDATAAWIDRVAESLGVSEAQRKIAGGLHRSLARGMPIRASVRSRDNAVEPALTISWDRVEWQPIQSMLGGFYPRGNGVDKIGRLARAIDADSATVELVLGAGAAPGVRFAFRLV